MQRFMLYAKIHRATVTEADLHYVGSLTIDRDLMDAAGLLPGEQVDVVDVDNGNRLTTYAIEGGRGTRPGPLNPRSSSSTRTTRSSRSATTAATSLTALA